MIFAASGERGSETRSAALRAGQVQDDNLRLFGLLGMNPESPITSGLGASSGCGFLGVRRMRRS